MFEKIFATLMCILVFAVICMASELIKLYRERKLRQLVSWIMVGNTLCVYSHDMPLWMYISNAQHKLGINKEYCISDEQDWEIVKEILKKFQTDIAQSYFKDNLTMIKSKYEIFGEHYFMFLLQLFLREHLCDYEFLGYDMHKERIAYKDYGHGCFAATYILSDFAVIYHKMYYIALVFCKNCKPIAESGILFDYEEGIVETLNTKQIQLSTY